MNPGLAPGWRRSVDHQPYRVFKTLHAGQLHQMLQALAKGDHMSVQTPATADMAPQHAMSEQQHSWSGRSSHQLCPNGLQGGCGNIYSSQPGLFVHLGGSRLVNEAVR